MLYNDLADQIPEDYVFIDLQKITAEGVVLAQDLKEAGKAGPIVISIAESGGEILAAIAGVMRGSMSAIVFLIWIIFKIVCKTLWLGYTSKPTPVPIEEPVRSEVIHPIQDVTVSSPQAVANEVPVSNQNLQSPSYWAQDDEDPELESNVAFTRPDSSFVQAMNDPGEDKTQEQELIEEPAPKSDKKSSDPKKAENWIKQLTGGKL